MHGEPVFTISLIIAAIALLALVAGFFNIGKSFKALKDFFGEEILGRSVKVRSVRSSIVILSLEFIILALALLFFFFSNNKQETASDNSSMMIFCLDISKSMDCRDVKPSRLNYAKTLIGKAIQKADNTEFAIVGFAGEAHTVLPLTSDKNYASDLINSVSTDYASNSGTNIYSALEKAGIISKLNSNRSCKIILISDGENFSEWQTVPSIGDNSEFISICVGSDEGGKIPSENGFYKDNYGNEVITKADSELMKQIANKINGKFIRQSTIETPLISIFENNNTDGVNTDIAMGVLLSALLLLISLEIIRYK